MTKTWKIIAAVIITAIVAVVIVEVVGFINFQKNKHDEVSGTGKKLFAKSGYSILYPADWVVSLSTHTVTSNDEVDFLPANAPPFSSYIGIFKDTRSLSQVLNVFRTIEEPKYTERQIKIDGVTAYEFVNKKAQNLATVVIAYSDPPIMFGSGEYNMPEVKEALASMRFGGLTNIPTSTAIAVPAIEERFKNLEDNFFQHHFVPSSTLFYGDNSFVGGTEADEYNIISNSASDCVSVYSRYTAGGDLLSSLAGDKGFRCAVSLDIFSPQYVQALKEKVNQYTENKYNKNLFAYHVCNLQNGFDVVAGFLWSNTTSPYYIEEVKSPNSDRAPYKRIGEKVDFSKNPVLLLINKNGVHELKDVQNFGATATGGETGPCEATLNKDNTILWKCFAGLVHVDGGAHGFDAYWLLSYDGDIIRTWETK